MADWPGHMYLNEEGYIVGWSMELIGLVCAEAGVTCYTIWDRWANCWQTIPGQHPSPGGLVVWVNG